MVRVESNHQDKNELTNTIEQETTEKGAHDKSAAQAAKEHEEKIEADQTIATIERTQEGTNVNNGQESSDHCHNVRESWYIHQFTSGREPD